MSQCQLINMELVMSKNLNGKLEWFSGNKDALEMYRLFVDLLHTWDDLVDKDKEVSEDQINHAFLICLVYLPGNSFYRLIQRDVMPMYMTFASAYTTANKFEKDKDAHGLEIAHILRYSAGNIISYAMMVATGMENSKKYMPEMWKDVVSERFEEYRMEHMQ